MSRRRVFPRLLALLGMALLAVVLAGCAGARAGDSGNGQGGTSQPQTITGTWQLVRGSDTSGTFLPGGAVVTFTFDGKTSGGHGPCNSFGATTAATTTGPVSITMGIHTDMACVDDDLNNAESRYFDALGKVSSAAIADGMLTLSGDGDSLQFTRAKK
jgi:heat shock protein HslJ